MLATISTIDELRQFLQIGISKTNVEFKNKLGRCLQVGCEAGFGRTGFQKYCLLTIQASLFPSKAECFYRSKENRNPI